MKNAVLGTVLVCLALTNTASAGGKNRENDRTLRGPAIWLEITKDERKSGRDTRVSERKERTEREENQYERKRGNKHENKGGGSPDLIVESITTKVTALNKKTNTCDFSIRYYVKNQGTAKAKSSHSILIINNARVAGKEQKVKGLAPNRRSRETHTGTINAGIQRVGGYADSRSVVAESNENNNATSVKVTCK